MLIQEFAHLHRQLSEPIISCYFHKRDSQCVSSCQSQSSAADLQDHVGDCVLHYFTL